MTDNEARAVPVDGDRERLAALSDEASPGPWVIERGSIAWTIRERAGGAQVGNVVCDEDAAFIVALVNAFRAGVSLTGSGLDRERLAALLADIFPEVHQNRWPFTVEDVADALIRAGVSTGDERLDVERLARAQVRSGIDTFLPGEDRWISANEAQAAIAREYAALSGESGEPTR
jgi:hypothetical protein